VQDQAFTIPLQLSRGLAVASLQVELSESVLKRFRDELLAFVARTQAKGVIMDLSGLEVVDASEFESLRRVIDMVRIMGAEVLVAGLRPGVVSSLIDLEVNTDGVLAAMNLDDAFDWFQNRQHSSELLEAEAADANSSGTESIESIDPPLDAPDRDPRDDAFSDSF
jgi:rsbT antagonist protein RsbS